MRKSAVFILSLIIAFTLATPICADVVYVYKCFEYTEEDNSITITGYYGRDSEITVPSVIAGIPVNQIAAGAFTNCKNVSVINLPETITDIEDGAFSSSQTVRSDSDIIDNLTEEDKTESSGNIITTVISESSQKNTAVSESSLREEIISHETIKTTSNQSVESAASGDVETDSNKDKTEFGEEIDGDAFEETENDGEQIITAGTETESEIKDFNTNTKENSKIIVIIVISVLAFIMIVLSVFKL